MRELLLGLDVGTRSVKGVLLDADGLVVADAASGPYAVVHRQPGWAEQNPKDWWTAVCAVIRQLCEGNAGDQIRGVGVSGQGCACTLVDAAGDVLRPAIIWLDTRSAGEASAMAERWGDAILTSNGNAVGAYNVEPKLLWLRDHEPDVLARATHSLTTTAYINMRLTGRAAVNHADGGILFAFDAVSGDWNRRLLDEMGVPSSLYPALFPCASIIGTVTDRAARETGLPQGVPVVAGGEDTPAAALSVGVRRTGDAFLSLGTAAVVGVCTDSDNGVREPRLLSYPHVLPGLAITSGSMSSAGASVQWLLREFGPAYGDVSLEGHEQYSGLNASVAESPPGANGVLFLPYLSGELHPILDAHARGVFFGLTLATSRNDVARAVIEGSAMAIRHNLTVAEQAGASVDLLHATGGPTRSEPWCQVIADVTGKLVRVVSGGGAPVGDALIAGAGVGLIVDPGETAAAAMTVTDEYVPLVAHGPVYGHQFEAYQRLYDHLRSDFVSLAERQANETLAMCDVNSEWERAP